MAKKKESKGYAYGEDDADDEKDWVEDKEAVAREGEEGEGGDVRPDPVEEVTAAAKVISDAIDKIKDNNPQLADRAQTLLADALRMGMQVVSPKYEGRATAKAKT